jgi:hypothetical protein
LTFNKGCRALLMMSILELFDMNNRFTMEILQDK